MKLIGRACRCFGMSTLTLDDLRQPRSLIILAGFLVVVIGVGALIGITTAPGDWYASLDKPPFNPPNWIFAPVWLVLYVCIAIAGWRTYLLSPGGNGMNLWVSQMVLNWLWSPIFFALHLLWPAFVVIVLMLAVIASFIADRWTKDRVAAWLFVPYFAWVALATLLNAAVAVLN